MTAAAIEVRRLDSEGAQNVEGCCAFSGEFVDENGHGFMAAGANIGESIKAGEVSGVTVVEDEASARNPVGALSVNEVGDNLAGSHGVGAFVLLCEGGRHGAQKRVERGRGMREECGDFVERGRHSEFFLGK